MNSTLRCAYGCVVATLLATTYLTTVVLSSPVAAPARPSREYVSGILTHQASPHDISRFSSMAATLDTTDTHWWDGFGIPGTDGPVSALAVYHGELIAAGKF